MCGEVIGSVVALLPRRLSRFLTGEAARCSTLTGVCTACMVPFAAAELVEWLPNDVGPELVSVGALGFFFNFSSETWMVPFGAAEIVEWLPNAVGPELVSVGGLGFFFNLSCETESRDNVSHAIFTDAMKQVTGQGPFLIGNRTIYFGQNNTGPYTKALYGQRTAN